MGVLLASAVASAQTDFGKSMSVPAGSGLNIPPSAMPSANKASIFDPVSKPGTIETDAPNINFGKPKEAFANPNEKVLEKLNAKNTEVDTAIRKDQDMGQVKTASKSVHITYRDHEFPDGDVCQVLVNGVIVMNRIYLESDAQSFDIVLLPGFNKIDFVALNQGESGPNTAEFEVYDESNKLIAGNRWNLATGFKASIIVVKE